MTTNLNVVMICVEARPVSTQFTSRGEKADHDLLVAMAMRNRDATQVFISRDRGPLEQYVIKRTNGSRPRVDLIRVTGLRLKGFHHVWTV